MKLDMNVILPNNLSCTQYMSVCYGLGMSHNIANLFHNQPSYLKGQINQLILNTLLFLYSSGNRSYYFRGICIYKPDEFHPQKTGLQIRLYFSASNSALCRLGTQNIWKEQINFDKLNDSSFTNFHCDFLLGNQTFCFSLLWCHKHQSRIRKLTCPNTHSVTNLYTKTQASPKHLTLCPLPTSYGHTVRRM